MPKALIEGKIRLDALATAPIDGDAITLAEATAAVNLSAAVMRTAYRLSPTGSDTLNEASLEDQGNAVTFGSSNYEANLTLFRYLDASGLSDEDQDIAFDLFQGKGIHLWLLERIGPPSRKPWAIGDPYSLYPVITDDPQQPTDLTGYVKFVQPLGVQGGVVLRGTITAPAGG